MSHPAWVCGLKHISFGDRNRHQVSHPAWVCGLKRLLRISTLVHVLSHPAWVCGLKLGDTNYRNIGVGVTPCVGVWIETGDITLAVNMVKSHPAWVCGLKPYRSAPLRYFSVTPCVGVWIETTILSR